MSSICKSGFERKPFLLAPAGKDYLWGGSRLNDDFSKGIDMYPLAETWECSTHPDGISTDASGRFAWLGLKEVLERHPEYLGTHPKADAGLPILVKLIDAKKDLSVQVHPSDEYAFRHEGGQLGKTEMWYVLDASKGAGIIYGFAHDMDKEMLRESINDGTVGRFLPKVPVKKNDVFFIEPGTVHAIGAGVLIAEIQESSNLTYRLYDYNRTDKNGCKRELHIDKAMDVAKDGFPFPCVCFRGTGSFILWYDNKATFIQATFRFDSFRLSRRGGKKTHPVIPRAEGGSFYCGMPGRSRCPCYKAGA